MKQFVDHTRDNGTPVQAYSLSILYECPPYVNGLSVRYGLRMHACVSDVGIGNRDWGVLAMMRSKGNSLYQAYLRLGLLNTFHATKHTADFKI